ncbi:tetratricopeptide repeat protein [Paracoccus sp. MBLB3053]|uniref:Tetratricopeptide repeat protein n=1 Tax=Paracoccus aurantius TaxID=3073814 RepID=A0ABU2HV97_9RHOB|nr:tetratricopeptide repeat protein [Paracoccus sp. MBLB3053]MDS9468450.1 tetratricopeptide repeat protein [Paracoccus sp. MBLB3053]
MILTPVMVSPALAQAELPFTAPDQGEVPPPGGELPESDSPHSQDEPELEPAEPSVPSADALRREREDLDMLFAELAQPDGQTWERAESDILRIWSRSGSASMDLLYKRGEAALDAGEIDTAIGHLTALTDHAPDFAAGWHLRAVSFYLAGKFGPAIDDLAHVLAVEPRHFAALTQLGLMFEELGDDERALAAYRASLKIHPHQQDAADAVERLEDKTKGTDA